MSDRYTRISQTKLVEEIKEWVGRGHATKTLMKIFRIGAPRLRKILRDNGIVTAGLSSFARVEGMRNMDKSHLIERAREMSLVNRSRATKYTAFGVTENLPCLCRRFAVVCYDTVRERLQRGFDIEAALVTPSMQKEVLKYNAQHQDKSNYFRVMQRRMSPDKIKAEFDKFAPYDKTKLAPTGNNKE